ncbi:MAG: fumarate hydratase [Candidatus Cloacimonetes bacterium]|nr:fumarate hydratase [Candidatus Cloacimonadota bacterium]
MFVKEIHPDLIHDRIIAAIAQMSFEPDPLVIDALQKALSIEDNELARDVLSALIQNSMEAPKQKIPLCQDTGTIVCFVEWGRSIHIPHENLQEVINSAVRIAYKQYYLRPSIVEEPLFERRNSLDNSPAIIHYEFSSEEVFKITLAQKGGGAENMSRLYMLKPSADKEEIVELTVKTICEAGGNPCPPLIVGIGLGGNFESVAILAKKALFRPLGQAHPDPRYAKLEQEILRAVNATGVGPQGLGGKTTTLAIHIQTAPCHIASLPLAINLQCHAHRHVTLDFLP